MAVFTGDNGMGGTLQTGHLVFVAAFAVLGVKLVNGFLVLPFLLIAQAMESVHVALVLYTKALWDIKKPDNKYQGHKTQHYEKRPPDMIFQFPSLLFLKLLRKKPVFNPPFNR
jgi:hypothetical protein